MSTNVRTGGEQRSCIILYSVATTLGVAKVSAQTMKLSQEHPILSEVVTDQEAVKAVERFVGEYNLKRRTTDLK